MEQYNMICLTGEYTISTANILKLSHQALVSILYIRVLINYSITLSLSQKFFKLFKLYEHTVI